METVKTFLKENEKIVKGIVIGLVSFVIISVIIYSCRQMFMQNERTQKEETGISVEMTNQQNQLINDYDSRTEDVINLLKNSKWMDSYQKKVLEMSDREIIEHDDKNEYRSTYAICSIEKVSNKRDGKFEVTYYITILDGENAYKNITFVKVSTSESETAPLFTATIESSDIFRLAKTYIRCSMTDKFEIKDGQNNAGQFIDGNYDEMYKMLKDYCSINFPAISAVVGQGNVTLNYFSNKVVINFVTDNNHTTTLYVVYDQKTKEMSIERK